MRVPNGSTITTAQAKLLARITFERHPTFHTNQRRSLGCLEADGYITPDNAGGWIPTDKGLVAAGYIRRAQSAELPPMTKELREAMRAGARLAKEAANRSREPSTSFYDQVAALLESAAGEKGNG